MSLKLPSLSSVDQDSLGIVMTFLRIRDFVRMARTSRYMHLVACRTSKRRQPDEVVVGDSNDDPWAEGEIFQWNTFPDDVTQLPLFAHARQLKCVMPDIFDRTSIETEKQRQHFCSVVLPSCTSLELDVHTFFLPDGWGWSSGAINFNIDFRDALLGMKCLSKLIVRVDNDNYTASRMSRILHLCFQWLRGLRFCEIHYVLPTDAQYSDPKVNSLSKCVEEDLSVFEALRFAPMCTHVVIHAKWNLLPAHIKRISDMILRTSIQHLVLHGCHMQRSAFEMFCAAIHPCTLTISPECIQELDAPQ